MKRMTNKNFIQKIVIGILIVLSFNFAMPTFSHAGFGGMLMGTLMDLITAIPDAIIGGLQFFMLDGNMGADGEVLQGYMVGSSDYSEEKYPSTKYDDSKVEKESVLKLYKDKMDTGVVDWISGDAYCIPVIKYSPEKIFSGKVPALDVNFINPRTYTTSDGYTQEEVNAMNEKSITKALQKTISSWYKALRNLAIVGLLSVLLYVGIRILLTSIASDKAKYKQMLMDWTIALCLLFFLHYIMSFTLTLTEMIVDGIGASNGIPVQVLTKEGGDVDKQFNTDLMGVIRLKMQYADVGLKFIYLAMYIAIVVYTVLFTWKYIKRAITMAFLTLMAPIVALTYPIDKIGDGKAQAFNMWLKEYIFNALLQPFHLILYTIFLGASLDIVVQNPIYAILFLAFIGPAEKILRKMFKFDSASTAGSAFAGAALGGAAFNLMKKGISRGKSSSSGSKGIRTKKGNDSDNAIEDKNKIGKDFRAFGGSNAQRTTNENRENLPSQMESNANASRNLIGDSNQNSGNASGITDIYGRPLVSQRATPNSQLSSGTSNVGNQNIQDRSIARGLQNLYKKPIKNARTSAHKYFGTPEGRKAALKNSIRVAGRTAARVGSAAAVGTVGLGIGMAGDDLEDVLKYGAAGVALGGTALGGRIADTVESVGGRINDTYMEGYLGDSNAADVEKRKEEIFLDDSRRADISEEFDVKGKELDSKMRQVAYYDTQGIKDNKAIKQSIKLEDEIKKNMIGQGQDEQTSEISAKEQATTIARIADNYQTEKLRTSEEYRKGVYADFRNGLKKVNPSMSEKQLKEQSEQMMTLLKKFKKID